MNTTIQETVVADEKKIAKCVLLHIHLTQIIDIICAKTHIYR